MRYNSNMQTDFVNPQRPAMQKEIAVYEELHPELVEQLLGQSVAIDQGRMIDHDVDLVTLHDRISLHYAGEVILCRKVQSTPKPVLFMRSPRLERSSIKFAL